MNIKKIFISLLVIIFLTSQNMLSYAYVLMPDYLCEIGVSFYQQGKVYDALQAFQKALIIKPDHKPALEYINMIEQGPVISEEPTIFLEPRPEGRDEAIKGILDRIGEEVFPSVKTPKLIEEEIALPQVLLLDKNIESMKFPIEIELEKSIVIRGDDIKRFLSTEPNVLIIEKSNLNEISVTANDFGYTYLHVWDGKGRWTLEFLTVPPKLKVTTYEELMRKEEEKARSFKLRYSADWSSYETGRRIDALNRSTYSWRHFLNLTGETPYGDLDSTATIRSLKQSTDLTYFTLGLEQARFGPFEDFTLRTFDFTPNIANLAFSGGNLRGAMLNSPAFNNKLDYTVLWGREGGGRYGDLSPGLSETKNSFISGLDINFSPFERQNYSLSVFHGWGRDRSSDLEPYGYDFDIDYNFDKWYLSYEIAHDTDTFAHLLNTIYTVPNLRLTTEFRDTSEDFKTLTGWGWRAGELGLLTTLSWRPTEKLGISSYLDVFRDRLYPAPDNENRWNEIFSCDFNYIIDPLTSLRLDFGFQNELGRISAYRSHSEGFAIYRTIGFIKKINTFLDYRHQESKYYAAPSGDYISDKIILGLRLSLIGDLYYYLNKEFNWFQQRYTGVRTRPEALETGVDWYGRIGDSPFYANFRFMFRDEEDTVAPLSLLAGQDYIEGYAELSYRPTPDVEGYVSARVRNVWAENPDVTKRIEANFYAGVRYLWDTGIRWESVGSIDGYVFKDFNSDGLRQENEPTIKDVKIWLGKDMFCLTDENGYYSFSKVKAKKAYVNIDTETVPSGFVLTVPAIQQVKIVHGRISRVDFGIISRNEIIGNIFVDIDRDGKLGREDLGVKDAILTLEDGSKAKTDNSGRYFFRNIDAGKHTIKLDLNSLPSEYLPTVPIFKDLELFEGTSYHYDIPLKKIE